MKKTTLVFAAFLAVCVAQAAPRTLAQIHSSGTLKLATEGAFPPFNFFDGKKLVGFEVDLGDALARDMGLKSDWVTQPFDSLLIGLNQNRYDAVLASHAITAERQKAVDFLSPSYCSTVNIIAKKGGPLSKAALSGKTIGTQIGTAQVPILKAIPGIKDVKTLPNDQAVLTALQAGRVDAWSTNGPVAAYMLKQTGLKDKITIGESISGERNAGAVAKGDAELHKVLEASLKNLMANGTYAKLSQKWFGQDIRCK